LSTPLLRQIIKGQHLPKFHTHLIGRCQKLFLSEANSYQFEEVVCGQLNKGSLLIKLPQLWSFLYC